MAEHLWSAIAQPGEDPIDAGARRCLRTGVAFSFENCLIADRAGAAIGLLHLLAMDGTASAAEPVDPALRPLRQINAKGTGLGTADVGSIGAILADIREIGMGEADE